MLLRWGVILHSRAALPTSARGRIIRTGLLWKVPRHESRFLHATSCQSQEVSPLRKELKDNSKAARAARRVSGEGPTTPDRDQVPGWELTVGIEIHAQLNTARKLFSGTQYQDVVCTFLTLSRCSHRPFPCAELSC
jgi:hypothetical protein